MTTEATATLTGTPETPVTTPATPSGGAEVNAATDPVPLFVYFPVQTPSGPRLARESIDVPGGTVGGAVAAMIAGPRDPDYLASWDPGTTVLSASEDDGVISLDLSAEVRRANTDATGTDLLAQQLVYTATEAAGAPDASVRLLIEGQTAGALWGTVAWDEPISRADVTAVRAAVQIDAPVQRQYITSETTTISGEALNPGPIAWRIVDAVGDEVASGEVQPDEETDPPSFSVTVELRVGRYTVEVSVPDPNDPSGAPVTDTRAFSVHLGA
ncbi:MAG: hypothetical protein EOL89_05385 [Actinobacteria bacterium]|nr:hypothetical protein [Actinomycetota bacterium]